MAEPLLSGLPKITIVTPSFNQGEFLEATIRSVLNQKYPNTEYIVMDGGSTDNSIEIIRRYASHLAHWESLPDRGQADAILRGFQRGTGEVLGWLNSDDLLLPGALANVGRFFHANPGEEWVVGGCLTIDKQGAPVRGRFGLVACNLGMRVTSHRLLFGGCRGFNQPASFWRRSAFDAVAGFDPSLEFCFDYDIYLRLARRRPSGHISRLLACYRIHSASKTTRLPHIHESEKELLLRKYGLYDYAGLYRKVMDLCYAVPDIARQRLVRVGLALNILRDTNYFRLTKARL